MIGTDLLNLGSIHGLGAPLASIGGAGTFDSIFPDRDRRSIDRQCPTVMEAGAGKAAVGRRGSVIREHS
jgi:uncharacterized protein DUF1614